MYVLVIAEKALQANSLAGVLLNGSKRRDSHLEGQLPDGRSAKIAALNGRVVDHYEPEDYHPRWRSPWMLDTLPFSPPDDQWKMRPTQPRILNGLSSLIRGAAEIVNACDAGREGELIFWSALRFLGWTPKQTLTTRIWVTDPSRAGVLRSWKDRRENTDPKYLHLLNAGYARWKADYLYGINMSRFASLLVPAYGSLGRQTYSVGRVKTAVLALIQRRVAQIEDFESENFYRLKCEFYSDRGNYFATVLAPEGMRFKFDDRRFSRYEDMHGVKVAIASSGLEWQVFDSEEAVDEFPPPPFSSLELQRSAVRKFGWSVKKTAKVAQELYEHDAAISYPRTESQTIPPGLRNEAEQTFLKLWKYCASEYEALASIGPYSPSEVYFSGEKLDHHAIIPTGVVPQRTDENGLTRDAYLLWDLIVRRFITALSPAAEIRKCHRILELTLPESSLTVRALLQAAPVTIPNWLLVEDAVGNSGGERSPLKERLNVTFPTTAATARMVQPHEFHGNTEPNHYFTEETLLLAMQKHNLGTAATRPDAIEELISADRYVERRANGRLFPTGPGAYLLEMLTLGGASAALDADLTASWEDYFDKLQSGTRKVADIAEFCRGVLALVTEMGRTLQNLPNIPITLCPDTYRIVNFEKSEAGAKFVFHGKYKNITFPVLYNGRRMSAAEWRLVILSGRGGHGPFKFISNKTGAPIVAKLRVHLKKQRFDYVFKKGGYSKEELLEEEPVAKVAA